MHHNLKPRQALKATNLKNLDEYLFPKKCYNEANFHKKENNCIITNSMKTQSYPLRHTLRSTPNAPSSNTQAGHKESCPSVERDCTSGSSLGQHSGKATKVTGTRGATKGCARRTVRSLLENFREHTGPCLKAPSSKLAKSGAGLRKRQ